MQTVNNIIVAADEPVGLNLTWSQVHKTCTNTEGGGGAGGSSFLGSMSAGANVGLPGSWSNNGAP